MRKRVITGVVYVLVWIVLCVLKWLVPVWGGLGFDALFCAISVLGSLELLRAVKGVSYSQKILTVAFCAVAVPLYTVTQLTTGGGFIALAVCFGVYVLALAAFNVFNYGVCTVKGTATCIFTMIYCGVLSCILSAVNHVENNSTAAVILLFLTVMFTDSGAFIFGSLFGKFVPRKLAPKVSPHKTLIGGLGGIIGGMLGGIAAYGLSVGLNALNGVINSDVIGTAIEFSTGIPAIVVFMLAGLVISVFAQIGDLFESAIKRECNVKDMGKLLPGHGGVLDRFDSMLFCGVIVLVAFLVVII
ncbi:MAG: phosphatidate cytidylyltransferase [Clostridia bacterium]|nr:phosphatidate cytidylyltransferase [Clostridia bacterium]MDE7264864.1 phosphatidate cytidylyltransferase [Clostridia bacterium]